MLSSATVILHVHVGSPYMWRAKNVIRPCSSSIALASQHHYHERLIIRECIRIQLGCRCAHGHCGPQDVVSHTQTGGSPLIKSAEDACNGTDWHGRETEISVTLGLDVTAQSPQIIKVSSGIGFLDHVSRVVL